MCKTKRCSKCKEAKGVAEFGRNRCTKDGLQAWCKECRKARQAKYRAENSEKAKASDAKYRAENQDKIKAKNAKYNAENPEKAKARDHRRRARKRNAPGSFTAEQLQARYDYHGNKCVYCLCEGEMTLEHQVPLSRGGSNWPANLVPACENCNCSKRDKTPAEFMEYRFGRLLKSFE